MANNTIHVVTGCYINEKNELLIVRKKNTSRYILPGGKPEAGESDEETLVREWSEELGVSPQGPFKLIGQFMANAANETGYQVKANVYSIATIDTSELKSCAEIDEYYWLPLFSTHGLSMRDETTLRQLAPLLQNEILPRLRDINSGIYER